MRLKLVLPKTTKEKERLIQQTIKEIGFFIKIIFH